jgi:hypothetical protein
MGNILRYLEVMRVAVGVGLVALALTVGYIKYQHDGEQPKPSTDGIAYLLELAGDASAGGNAALQEQVERAVRDGDLDRAGVLLGPVAQRSGQSSKVERELRVSRGAAGGAAVPSGSGAAPSGRTGASANARSRAASAGNVPDLPPHTVSADSPSPLQSLLSKVGWCSNGDCGPCDVPFPSVAQLRDPRQGPDARTNLDRRLRCEYERADGGGQGSDEDQPSFEKWRQAALEREYGSDWPIAGGEVSTP